MNGIPHGFGRMITAQFEQIVGYFKYGRPCGKVIFIDDNHQIVFEGLIQNSSITHAYSSLPMKDNISRLSKQNNEETEFPKSDAENIKFKHSFEVRKPMIITDFSQNEEISNNDQ